MLGSFFYILGAFVQFGSGKFCQHCSQGSGISFLIAGRIIYGIGCGFTMHAAPAYIAEMSPSSIRGTLVSLKEAAIVVGILMGYLVGYSFQNIENGWTFTYGVSLIPACIVFFGMYMLPPSSRWLMLQGQYIEAKKSLSFIYRNPTQVEAEFLVISADFQGQEKENEESGLPSILDAQEKKSFSDVRKQLIVGLGIVALQQVTGQPSVLYYANNIFQNAGIGNIATVGVALFKLLMTLSAVVTVDKYGRKSLLLIGIFVMFCSLVILTVAFIGYDENAENDKVTFRQCIIIIAMFLYVGGYQIGFGPIAWLLVSEIFPLELRGQCISLAVSSNFLWNLIVTFLFPVVQSALGSSLTFGIFVVICAYALYFTYAKVPETKGLTLEEIEAKFNSFGNNYGKLNVDIREPLLQDETLQ